MQEETPSLAWSDFAAGRHVPGRGYSYFDGPPEAVLELVRAHWKDRKPGHGFTDLTECVVVPVPPEGFVGGTVLLTESTQVRAEVTRRQPEEDPYVRLLAEGEPEPVRYAAVVLYSKDRLLENGGRRSSSADWEIVSLIAAPREDEPMHPLTLARNYLGMPGGSPMRVTVDELAEATYYWSMRVRKAPD